MRYHKLGTSDLIVSEACIGTMTFAGSLAQDEAERSVSYAIDHNVNFFDTADIYPPPPGRSGDSERFLGQALKPYRRNVILATKAGGPMGDGPDDRGLGRKHLVKAVEESLRRLDTDYIDLYYLHFPDPSVSSEEIVETMSELVHSGKIRYWGVSNFPAWKVCEMMHLSGECRPVVFEGVYNLISRSADDELMPFLKAYQLGFTAYNPLAGGMLTGKYLDPSKECKSGRLVVDRGYRSRYYSERQLEAAGQLKLLADRMEMSLTEFAFRWLRSLETVTSTIIGYSRMEQLEQNLRYFETDEMPEFPEDEIHAVWKLLDRTCHPYAKF